MRRQFVVGFLVLALSAAAVASAGAVGRADGRSCTTQRFAAVIQALGTDGVALKVQGRDRAVTFRLLARTQIRRQDRPVPVTALAVGQKVLVEVRTCQGGGGPTEVALVSIRLVGAAGEPTGDGTPTPPSPAPPAPAAVCARGDFTAPVAVVGADSVSFTSNGVEGLEDLLGRRHGRDGDREERQSCDSLGSEAGRQAACLGRQVPGRAADPAGDANRGPHRLDDRSDADRIRPVRLREGETTALAQPLGLGKRPLGASLGVPRCRRIRRRSSCRTSWCSCSWWSCRPSSSRHSAAATRPTSGHRTRSGPARSPVRPACRARSRTAGGGCR